MSLYRSLEMLVIWFSEEFLKIVLSQINDKQDDFNFETVNFAFLDGDVPRSPSYGDYI